LADAQGYDVSFTDSTNIQLAEQECAQDLGHL
jgi:hypothetical protein